MGQHCSSTMSVWMVAVLICHGSNIVLLLCQCGWLFFSKMPWFQHCSSIMSVWIVVVLKCHGSYIVLLLCQCGWLLFYHAMVPSLFFYYVSVDGCCSNMPWLQHCSSIMSVWMVAVLTCHGSNIVLMLCQCGWLLF